MKERIYEREPIEKGSLPPCPAPLWEKEWVEYEEQHLDRPPHRPSRLLLPINKLNRQANIAIAHGCWVNGVYRDNGIPRPGRV